MTSRYMAESDVATMRANASMAAYDPQNAEWFSPPLFSAFARGPEADTKKAAWRARVDAWEQANADLVIAWGEAESEEAARIYARADRERRRKTLADTGMPGRCVGLVLDGLTATTATAAVETFLTSKKTFLLLSGSPGCGKTLAACLALRGGGEFARAVEVSRFSLFDRADRDAFEALQRTRMLVLDDLGAEMLHDGWRPALDELLDFRYGEMRPTILTTNLPPTSEDEAKIASFRGRYGARIADRIRHDGLIEKCGDKSLRVRP